MQNIKWLALLGDLGYQFLLALNPIVNAVRRILGFGYWSLNKAVKQRVKDAIVRYAGHFNVEGVLCDHIHNPIIRQIGEVTYYNCGAWVENCSALVEHDDGEIELLTNWQPRAASRPRRPRNPMKKKRPARQEQANHEVSPARSLLIDLVSLRRTLRRTGRAYLRRLEAEIDEVAAWASEQARERDLPKARIRDLGDMITLVRKIEPKPIKGRRRDLKKIDATVGDLREMIGHNASR